ncbi:MAG: hypothetical protein AVDCRST_MAG89-3468, partial [uncultured Gemmatimonadetes bacterium]
DQPREPRPPVGDPDGRRLRSDRHRRRAAVAL